jgi:hypothetical protein
MLKKKVGCCCAWAGKTRGAVRVCLEFGAPPFVSRQKVETLHLRRITKRRKSLTAMLRQVSITKRKKQEHLQSA